MTLNERIDALEARLHAADEHLSVKRNALMARYTTLHLGGPADILVSPDKTEQIPLILKTAHALEVPVIIVGNGSNLLVKDGGIRGLVLRLCRDMQHIEIKGSTIRAEAGAMMSTLSMAAAQANLAGLTFASGIPGTVGGGVYMNAGAYGGEMSQVVSLVEGYDMTGEPFRYNHYEMDFGHRHTRLMDENKLITHVTFQLKPGRRDELLAEMVDFNTRRAEKQPLTQFSAGSTFKRPPNGFASAMVDQCGLKGFTVGGAQVSEKHAGFCINKGGTAADFLALMAEVQKVVYEKFDTMLEPEVRILGEDAPATEV
ncbi:MAG: UDP-N-acetylmuramate dehydrogenase [Clostridiales bacterium]|nr:UDP-N-acetylmuramate dehydrogenase [Clostridiales bacterium]